jgi:hypothetical protein
MIAKSRTEELVVFSKRKIRQLKRDIGRLFMDMGNVDSDPEIRVANARKDIDGARAYIAAFMQRYPAAQYPKKRFRKVHELFAGLAASCDTAERRMQSFKNIRLPGNGHTH